MRETAALSSLATHVDAFPLNIKEWLDTDSDGMGNGADSDDDNDGAADMEDPFPLDPTKFLDSDSDGIMDSDDTDDDNDGKDDTSEYGFAFVCALSSGGWLTGCAGDSIRRHLSAGPDRVGRHRQRQHRQRRGRRRRWGWAR